MGPNCCSHHSDFLFNWLHAERQARSPRPFRYPSAWRSGRRPRGRRHCWMLSFAWLPLPVGPLSAPKIVYYRKDDDCWTLFRKPIFGGKLFSSFAGDRALHGDILPCENLPPKIGIHGDDELFKFGDFYVPKLTQGWGRYFRNVSKIQIHERLYLLYLFDT